VQIQNRMQKRRGIKISKSKRKTSKRKINQKMEFPQNQNIRNQKQIVEDKFAKRDFVLENHNNHFQLFVVKLNH